MILNSKKGKVKLTRSGILFHELHQEFFLLDSDVGGYISRPVHQIKDVIWIVFCIFTASIRK